MTFLFNITFRLCGFLEFMSKLSVVYYVDPNLKSLEHYGH